MFCNQCQETAKNQGCTIRGVCGKEASTSDLQDRLIDALIDLAAARAAEGAERTAPAARLIVRALFATVTNVSFDDRRFEALQGEVETLLGGARRGATLRRGEADARSLRELVLYGLKGMAAYVHHAEVLGYEDAGLQRFFLEALAALAGDPGVPELLALTLRTGEQAVKAMELLDRANTQTYGHPALARVPLGVRGRPGILISGHDLKDLEELLRQSEGQGVDVYTHGEMLPAHAYPAFRKFGHLAGNYGNAWWKQQKEFEAFGGPIVMTTNCLVPVKDSYRGRIWTTGLVGFPGVRHVPDRPEGGAKDFSEVIRQAQGCPAPTALESGELSVGFARNQVLELAGAVVEAVKSGAIRRFVVMAGCDGRQPGRAYFSEVAEKLPADTVILTAGCAKYRYNKLDLGSIGGIPRVLDAGQCNDSYSLAVIALKLKEAFGLADVNELPVSFDLAWYEQKAVAVLLALLHLGFKGIRLGPTLPAFLSPGVAKVLVEKFGIRPIGEPEADAAALAAGR